INRMDYRIEPGLYAVGAPDRGSPVLVTANYKLTFDALRKELGGLDAWVLVLDTKGINVWCAAGKGTFGTEEIIRRVAATGLHKVVDHRTLILPQLGAPGTSAHKVSAAAGFKVVYGPVRAADIKKFIKDGYKATPEMRRVEFKLYDRFVLTPVELAQIVPKTLLVLGVLFILNAAGLGPFGLVELYAVLGALAAGCFLTPLLLPFIPGRAFAWKGFLLGLIWAIIVNLLNGWPGEPSYGWLKAIGFILALPPISSYLAMNFTGASTYTSPSGVLKEMKISLPPMLVSLFAGCVLILANNIIGA
ncbi:MAG: acetyl-CoA synthase subunit gamma, partial [Clostridiales bacterium]|nr:acetyl-CoA synthase subunit gamma [Clostridiales bacterium]